MSNNNDIGLALRHRLSSLDLSSPVWPQWGLAVPGSDYFPASGNPYLSIGRVNSQPTRAMINRNVRDMEGFFMVSAIIPIGQDVSIYEEVEGRIADHFMGCVRYRGISLWFMSSNGGLAYPTGHYRSDAWMHCPVRIPWKTWR